MMEIFGFKDQSKIEIGGAEIAPVGFTTPIKREV